MKADLHVFEAMTHGGFLGQAPEDLELLKEHVKFMLDRMGRPKLDSPGAPEGAPQS